MALTPGMFPYDIGNLIDGPVRCLHAPISQTLPTDISDIIDMVGPDYDPKDGWVDFGATAGPFVQGRNITATAYNIQQTTNAVRERITETTRTVQVSMAEFSPEHMKMIEEGAAVTTIAAGANAGAQKSVEVGSISELTQYRMAFVGRRGKDQGEVTEPGGGAVVRGRLFGFVAYRCQLSADNQQISLAEGDLGNVEVTFRLYPEPGQTANEEHGFWVFEDAGTIAGP